MTGTIVQFLYESGLITTDSGPVVKLAGANLDRVLLMDVGFPPRATQIDLRKARSDMRNRGARESLCEQPIPEPERDLSGVSLRRARLDEGALISVDLSDADLREAALRGTRLAGSRLINANLSDAILTGADLRSADLRRTTCSTQGCGVPN
jgi:uncharacterized protein YjbI with pentapeptide repeats